MGTDLVVNLTSNSSQFVQDMQRAAGQVQQFGDTAKKINNNVNTLRFAMAANQLGVMIQDMTTVASMGANFNQILNAGANNLIQMATLVSPIGGALAAAGIAGLQLYNIFSGNVAQAKRFKEEVEAGTRALLGAIDASVDNPRTKADVDEVIEREEKKADAIRNIRNKNNKEISKIEDQVNVLGFRKTLTEQEQKTVDLLKAENAEYNKSLAAITAKKAQLEAERILSEEAGGFTTKQIEEQKRLAEEIRKKNEEQAKHDEGQENAAERLHAQAKKTQDQWRADMEARRRADAEMVRDALMPPEQRLGKEANRLSFLGLTDYEMSQTLMKQAASAFAGGPQLSAGLVKGTIEEESFRNRKEAENRMLQAMRQMVDKIIRELKPKEPPPEVVVGGGH